jgi:hypothetical protein
MLQGYRGGALLDKPAVAHMQMHHRRRNTRRPLTAPSSANPASPMAAGSGAGTAIGELSPYNGISKLGFVVLP